jgi:hypothetical protein
VVKEAPHWDEVTRRVVLDRIESVPDIRFFTDAEARTLGVFCDAVLAQDNEPRVPVLNMVDAKLFASQLDGYMRQTDTRGRRRPGHPRHRPLCPSGRGLSHGL